MTNPSNIAGTQDSEWKGLFKAGGAAAVSVAVLYLIQIAVFVGWGRPPNTVLGFFTLFQNNRFLGLLDMDLLSLVDYALMGVVTLALYVALRQASRSFMTIATALGFVGVAVYYASNTAFSMLSLSDQYATAATEAERSTLLTAGQAMLAIYQGTAFIVSYLLWAIAPMMISVVMFRSKVFSRKTAYAGIVANAFGLAYFVPVIGPILAIIDVVGLVIWFILVGRRLLRLGSDATIAHRFKEAV